MTTPARALMQSRGARDLRRVVMRPTTKDQLITLTLASEDAPERLLECASTSLGVRSQYAGFWTTYLLS